MPRLDRLRQDLRSVQPLAVVGDDDFDPIAMLDSRDGKFRTSRLADGPASLGRFDAVVDRIAHHMHQRVDQQIDHAFVDARFAPLDHDVDVLLELLREIPRGARQPAEQAVDRDHAQLQAGRPNPAMRGFERVLQRSQLAQIIFDGVQMPAHLRVLRLMSPEAPRVADRCRHPAMLHEIGEARQGGAHFSDFRHEFVDSLAPHADERRPHRRRVGRRAAVRRDELLLRLAKTVDAAQAGLLGIQRGKLGADPIQRILGEDQELEAIGAVAIDRVAGNGFDRRREPGDDIAGDIRIGFEIEQHFISAPTFVESVLQPRALFGRERRKHFGSQALAGLGKRLRRRCLERRLPAQGQGIGAGGFEVGHCHDVRLQGFEGIAGKLADDRQAGRVEQIEAAKPLFDKDQKPRTALQAEAESNGAHGLGRRHHAVRAGGVAIEARHFCGEAGKPVGVVAGQRRSQARSERSCAGSNAGYLFDDLGLIAQFPESIDKSVAPFLIGGERADSAMARRHPATASNPIISAP